MKGATARDAVLDQLQALMFAVRGRLHQALREEAGDGVQTLTPLELRLLMGLGRRDSGLTQAELVQRSGRDKAQMTRLLHGLEQRGLVEREPDPADRRRLLLRLTTDGRALRDTMEARRRRLVAGLLAGLGDDEVQQLGVLLGRLLDNLAPTEPGP
jgi:DNA-binding MarR family transcriptional regulator